MTALALAVRIGIAVLTRTFFQPDEYFQSLEPAHHLVFGYGRLTWEWTNTFPIRSILYPAINIPIYWVLKVTGLHDADHIGDLLMIYCPRVLHGALAALTDIALCQLTRQTLGERYVATSLFLSLTSFFHALSLSRSLSNSLETSLCTIAFSYYPWNATSKASPHVYFNRPKLRKMILFAALACAVRPTNAIIWVFLFANLMSALKPSKRLMFLFLRDTVAIGCSILAGLVIMDTIYYGQVTFTPYNFLVTNLSSVSLFYGENTWHYHFSQSIWLLGTTAMPYFFHGVYLVLSASERVHLPQRNMLRLLVWTLVIYSLPGHKEWRFLHPLLPLIHVLSALSFVDVTGYPTTLSSFVSRHRWKHTLCICTSFPVSVFIVLVYCRAPIRVTSFIQQIPRSNLIDGVGILMPCHSIPEHAYLHRPELADGRLWALGCEPPLADEDLQDQTAVFFESPVKYMTSRFPENVNISFPKSPHPYSIGGSISDSLPWAHEWPRYLIFFGALLENPGVEALLRRRGYQEIWSAGWAWEGDSSLRKGGVHIWTFS